MDRMDRKEMTLVLVVYRLLKIPSRRTENGPPLRVNQNYPRKHSEIESLLEKMLPLFKRRRNAKRPLLLPSSRF